MRQERLNKKKKLLRGVSLTFLIAILLVILWIIFFKNRSYTREYDNKYFSFKYDTTWKVSKEESSSVSLVHKTDSIVDIKINNLGSNYLNSEIEQIVSEIKFDIEKQNSNYKLLKEEKMSLTNYAYEGYKILYENGDSQSLIVILRNDNYVCIINYISNNVYFDMLLDSFQFILGSIKLK